MKKYENIKSVILAVLVVASAILTWNIWTYQPDYETINNHYLYEVEISENRDASSLIKPVKIIFHKEGAHYGTVNERDIDTMMKELMKWKFYDFRNVSRYFNQKELQRLVNGNGRVDIEYSAQVPLKMYQNVLHFEDKKLPNGTFDHIILNDMNTAGSEATVYFVSVHNKAVYKTTIASSQLKEWKKIYLTKVNDKKEYSAYKFKTGTVYLPKEKTTMIRYKYIPDFIETEKFKDALFSDPHFVKKNVNSEGEEYTDGSSLMRVNYTNNMMFYVNPAQEAELGHISDLNDLMGKSIQFVNEHGGWTDKYRYFDSDLKESKIVYRLFVNGYPVFNENGMAEIQQYWGKEKIYKYERPYFTLNISLPSETVEITLPSAQEALDFLSKQPDFNPDLLEDMEIGYQLIRSPQTPKILILEPAWYYKYGESWFPLTNKNSGGGNQSGLE
ncbi:two-component system activity regulator YycH [Bacillus smithii]|jgi:regulatory protein YycH of two-component signal transduction system YycFG|uniref:YycH family regulatory protein n=1 Tax=Bacillus smithii TaxID=1479 RepID=UPI003D20DA21